SQSFSLSLHDALPIYEQNQALPGLGNRGMAVLHPAGDSLPADAFHDAVIIRSSAVAQRNQLARPQPQHTRRMVRVFAFQCQHTRSEEHTSELQSRFDL